MSMEALQKKKYVKPMIRFVTDMDIILECLHETYGMEGEQVLSGKNIYATMIYPFVKMLENQCEGISAEEIHQKLWESYRSNMEKDGFVKNAILFLKPYKKEQFDETE